MSRPDLVAALAAGSLLLAACSGHDDASPGPSGRAAPDGSAAPAQTEHVDNPFAGARLYVNEAWSARVNETADAAEGRDAALADQMRAVAGEPTAVWLDRIAAIEGSEQAPGLRAHLDAALAQRDGDEPVVVTLVIYDLPGRDCFALASNGELPASDEGLARYEHDYIDPIAQALADPEYASLRFALIVEPDSLPNLVTNSSAEACRQADPFYRQGVVYALDAFAPIVNAYTYLDAAHAGWLGWDSNAGPTAQLFADVARSTEEGFASIDGFATNTANYTPLVEPFLSADAQAGGQQVKQSSFYEFNPDLDEAHWTADLHARLVAAGFPESIGMVVDTSRNGWGGAERPAAASSSADLEAFVAESKVDRRTHRGAWCNQAGAGLGLKPQALPAGYPQSHLDALLWIKPPGESDGSSSAIDNDEGKGFDPMCDPGYTSDRLAGHATNALPDAPVSGHWFSAQFEQLVANAFPAADEPNPAPRDDPHASDPVGGDSSPSPSATPSETGAPAPPVGASGDCTAVLALTNTWPGGFQADVTVTAARALTGWRVSLPLPAGARIDSLWNGVQSGQTGTVTVTNADYNGAVAARGTVTFGFTGTGDAPADLLALACAAG